MERAEHRQPDHSLSYVLSQPKRALRERYRGWEAGVATWQVWQEQGGVASLLFVRRYDSHIDGLSAGGGGTGCAGILGSFNSFAL